MNRFVSLFPDSPGVGVVRFRSYRQWIIRTERTFGGIAVTLGHAPGGTLDATLTIGLGLPFSLLPVVALPPNELGACWGLVGVMLEWGEQGAEL